jgi:hypothetical protein
MAIIDLGKVSITWKGAYSGGTAYTPKDAVVYNNASYICIANTTGNLPTDTTYWNVMAAKGVDGTDVGTTLTTQGDVLYRDGSGLQRLAKGTANQTLQMNGGATAPTWVTAESGTHVKLAEANYSSAVSNVTFNNIFTADYDIYKVYFFDISSAANNDELRCAFQDSGGNNIGSIYTQGVYSYVQTNGNTGGNGHFTQDSDNNIRFTGEDIDSIQDQPSTLTMEIFNAYQSDVHTDIRFNFNIRASNNYYYSIYGAAHVQNNASLRNMIFKQNSGTNFAGYKTTIYGVKR